MTKTNAWRSVLKVGLIPLKLGIASLFLWWLGVFSESTVEGLRSASGSPLMLAGATALAVGAIHLYWLRWYILLHFAGVPVSPRHSYRVHYASVFFGFFLPGNTGLDLTRLAYVWRGVAGTRSLLAVSVFVDRVMGFIGLLFTCILALVAAWVADVSSEPMIWIAGLAFVVFVFVIVVLFMLPVLTRWVTSRFGRWMPERITLLFSRLAEAFAVYRLKPGVLISAVAISCVNVVFTVVCLLFLLKAFGAGQVSLPALAFAFPYSAFANMLPITPGGLGVGEYSFVTLYEMAGGISDAALVAGAFVAYRIVYLLASLPGLFMWLFFRSSLSVARQA